MPKPSIRSPLVAALIVFVLAVPAIALIKANTAPHYALSKAEVLKVARSNGYVRQVIEQHDDVSARVSPIDRKEQRASFFEGSRLLVLAGVDPQGHVTRVAARVPGTPDSGSRIANAPPMLLLLTLVFALATVTLPLVAWRNLDVVALTIFTGTLWLLNDGFDIPSAYVSYPPLAYLAARCMLFGLKGPADAPATPLLWRLTRDWPAAQRTRVMRLIVAAAALTVAMVVPSSTGANDVAFANVAGATGLLHGVAPYGHIPDFIVHGDTYPFLSYVLYIPAAAVMPVYDLFSDPTGALLLTAAATLLAAAGLYRIGVRLAGGGTEEALAGRETPRFAGMRLALAWLTFPAVIVSASSGTNDPLLAAILVAALAFFGHRVLSVLLLGAAAWVKVLPALALPIWLARLGRGEMLRAVAGLAALSVVLVGWLVAIGGSGAVSGMIDGISYQVERGSLHSLWLGLGISELQPLAGAALIAAIVAATLAVRQDSSLGDDPRRMAALLAAVLLLAQIAANYWTWAYLPWALVPILLSLLAPVPASVTVSRQRGATVDGTSADRGRAAPTPVAQTAAR
jgi:hypothetical protein